MQIWLYKVKGYKEKTSVELHTTKVAVERISESVLVVTKRILAVIALCLYSPRFRFHDTSLSPIFLLDICNIYQLCFV